MSVRVVTTGGPAELSYESGGEAVTIGNGMMIAVEPGSELEDAIGAANIPEATDAQLAAASNGAAAGWTANT